MKTIKQIADELGVSKQAVHKKIKRQPLADRLSTHLSTVDGVIYVVDAGVDMIIQAFKASTVNQLTPHLVDDNTPSTEVDSSVDALLSLLQEQQRTIAEQQQAINRLTDHNKMLLETVSDLVNQFPRRNALKRFYYSAFYPLIIKARKRDQG